MHPGQGHEQRNPTINRRKKSDGIGGSGQERRAAVRKENKEFGSKLDDEIGERALARPEVARAVEQAKRQPLAVVEVSGVPDDVAATVRDSAQDASVTAFHMGLGIATILVALGGVLGLIAITNPRRRVSAADCPGGQLVGHPREAARQSPCDWDAPVPAAVTLSSGAAEGSGAAR